MEYGSIEREILIEASPEVVFEVISSPEHVREWWSDEADFGARPGEAGRLVWYDAASDEARLASMTVVETDPPRRFSFRWTHSFEEVPTEGNSLLVTFELTAVSAGTMLRLTETGFREVGWELAVLEEQYQEHVAGWGLYVPRLSAYAAQLAVTR